MILSVTLNPSIDRTVFVERVKWSDTNRVRHAETDAGGKGVNLSRVAAELGAETFATGFLGGGGGAYIRRVLDHQGVQHDFVEILGETRLNISIEDESDAPPTTFNEMGPQIEHQAWILLLAKIEHYARGANWITLGGSLPPGLPIDAYREITDIVRRAGNRILLDADGEALKYGLQSKPDLIKPNAKEVSRLLNREVSSLDEGKLAAVDLLERVADDGIVIVSLGSVGAVLAAGSELLTAVPPKIDAKSTIGSGDSLLGGFLSVVERGGGIEEALRVGIAAGAATAMTDGSEIARRPVVEELLNKVQIARTPI